jgi:hypothetical protein
MILSFVPTECFWTVVSLYFHEGALDGQVMGKYTDTMEVASVRPSFSIKEPPSPPKILFKTKRRRLSPV